MNILQDTVNTELVRYAVQRALTCPECRHILDVEDAVLVTHTGTDKTAVCCGGCWDTRSRGLTAEQRAALDIIDTRPPRTVVARIKGTRGTVALAFKGGKQIVPATIYGALAVHKTSGTSRAARYTITHVATGFAAASDLRLGPARQLAAALQPLDWNFTTPRDLPRETAVQAQDIIRPYIRLRLGRNVA